MEKFNGKDKCFFCYCMMFVVQFDNYVNLYFDVEEIEWDRVYVQKIVLMRDEFMLKFKLKIRISKIDKCQYFVKCDRGCNQVVFI